MKKAALLFLPLLALSIISIPASRADDLLDFIFPKHLNIERKTAFC